MRACCRRSRTPPERVGRRRVRCVAFLDSSHQDHRKQLCLDDRIVGRGPLQSVGPAA
jgi:hypothetical protein